MWCVTYKWNGREYQEYTEAYDSTMARALIEAVLKGAGVFDYIIVSVKRVGKG